MAKTTVELDIPTDAAERVRQQEEHMRLAHQAVVPIATMQAIATAIVKRVAELPDRTSPDDWPQAMLVTSEELRHIIMSEFDAELG